MFPAMRTILQSSCERVQLTLTVVLLVACAANVALVCAWL
ncbi:MAG: glucose transporter [Xanthobacteraceae bacterium]|nr:glucose transporter [Xanthobacteraceae bacterium]